MNLFIGFVLILLTLTVYTTWKAGKRETKTYRKFRVWAVGFWLICFITLISGSAYLLQTHGIKFQPAPISLTSK